jgi:uncharacterized protein Yka (UPF0111/DUF47 family)
MGILDRVFNGGEYRVMEEIVVIAEIAKKANMELRNINDSNVISIEKVKALEQESDEKVFQLSNMISSGAISPNVLSDMLALVENEDSIVDSIFNLAREIKRYKVPNRKIAAMVKKDIITTTRLVDGALDELVKMERSSDLVSIKKYRKTIEKLESEEDDIKDGLLDYIYKNEVDFKTFNYINEIAHKCDDILDNCEDSADMFMSIMVSITT